MEPSSSTFFEPGPGLSGLFDLPILYPGGRLLGRVDEMLIDLPSGRIAYLVAEDPRRQRRMIPWHKLTFTGRAFVITYGD